jgi:Tfp pilus assembly protein PilF
MPAPRTIFVSAVSDEFHNARPGNRRAFDSYRDVLKQAFHVLAPHYEVIIEEDLVVGFGTLLETLDREVSRSLVVIHLIGDLAGYPPEQAALRDLQQRHPDLLVRQPRLQALLGSANGITYTQWEAYLALHYGKPCLALEVRPEAPRSPLCNPTEKDRAAQAAHLERLASTGQHRGTVCDQGDTARKAMRAFLEARLDPEVDAFDPAPAAVDEAWRHREAIVVELAAAIKKPDSRHVPVADPANVAAFVGAVRAAAGRWHVNLATIIRIAARHETQVRAATEERPTPEALREQALAEFALGDYTAARYTARRAAELALRLREQEPLDAETHDQSAINALLLAHEAAKSAHDHTTAIADLEEAGALVEKETLLWAEIHETLAEYLLDQAHYDRADDLISEIIDFREEYQGETHEDLARSLILWSRLLYDLANYQGSESVAARAERIFEAQDPPALVGIGRAISRRANALMARNHLADAEPLLRRALLICEHVLGTEHPSTLTSMGNMAALLQNKGEYAEAEALLRRALLAKEHILGTDHPSTLTSANNLGDLLQSKGEHAEAESLVRRALLACERVFGPDHPDTLTSVGNLARLLARKGEYAEAEQLFRRAYLACERVLGPDHPKTRTNINNLAGVLFNEGEHAEAEQLFRQAYLACEHVLGPDHPDTLTNISNLAGLLYSKGEYAEAEPLFRRVVEGFERGLGSEHPDTRNAHASLGWCIAKRDA